VSEVRIPPSIGLPPPPGAKTLESMCTSACFQLQVMPYLAQMDGLERDCRSPPPPPDPSLISFALEEFFD